MNELIVAQNNLPTTVEDLSAFVLFNDEKVKAVRAALSAMHKFKAPREVYELKLREAQELSEQVALAKMELGKRISEIPKATTNHKNQDLEIDSHVDFLKPKSETIAELGLTQKQAEHFQQMAKNPDAVQAAMTKAREAGDVVSQAQILNEIQQAKKPHVTFNSGNNEWYTPADIIENARKVLGNIDLDPASSEIANETVKAEKFFTAEDDGLAQIWEGNIWLNPPYSSGLIEKFADKLIHSDYRQAIVLVNNSTDTTWFAQLAELADAVVFPKGRVKFSRPDGSIGAPLQGQAILYFGTQVQKFKDTFEHYGRCWQ